MRASTRLLRAAGGVALAVGAGLALAPAGGAETGWRATARPFGLSFLDGERRVTSHPLAPARPGPGARLGYVLADGSAHRVTNLLSTRRIAGGSEFAVATTEPGRRATVTVRRTPRGLRVEWRLLPESGVAVVYEAFAAGPRERFLGSGQRGRYVELSGRIVPLKVWADCDSSLPVPFFFSTAGYGVFLDTTATGQLQFRGLHADEDCEPWLRSGTPLCPLVPAPDRVQACVRAGRLAYEVYTGPPARVLAAYTARSGRPVLPPPSQFALIHWRDRVDGPETLVEDADRIQGLGIPLGWVLLDNPWEEGCYGSLRFAPAFADPARWIGELRRRGVRLMLWVAPYVRCPPARYEPGELVGSADPAPVDLTSEGALVRFKASLRAVFAAGVDGVKGDRGDHVDLEPHALVGGPGTELHNAYPRLFARAVTEVLRERKGRDFAAIFRAGYAGSQRLLPAVWAGDQPGTFEGLRRAIRMAQSAGVSGFPVWGSDVGGYLSASPPVTEEVFLRWAQLGSVSPVFEVGGQGPNAEFWTFGPRAVQVFRRSAVLHYELFPYLYELARLASRTGVPILRPLGFEYPGDERAWRSDLQLLVGRDLLAAPVTAPARAGAAAATVYLPAGRWTDLFSGRVVQGGRTVVRRTPLQEFPLYLRRGAAIPFNLRRPDVWSRPWRLNDLHRAGRAGWLYAPGPGATAASSVEAGTFRAERGGKRLAIRLGRARRETQVLVLSRTMPAEVRIGGRAVPRAASLAALRRAATGWTFTRGPFGGILLKLAPVRGAAAVDIVLR